MPEPTKKSEILFAPVDVEGLKTPGQQIGPMRIAIQDGWPKEPKGAWHPGDYLNKCRCGVYFCGRKHSAMCWPCAEKYDQEAARIARNPPEPKQATWLTKAEIARTVAGGYRDGAEKAVWIDPTVAREIAERIAAASFAKGAPEPELSAARERIREMGVAVVPDLPTWEDGESKLQRGEKLTALEKFVMDHDWHKTDTTFRNGLEAVFAELRALPSSRVAGEGQTIIDESELVALRCINDAVQIIGDQASETRNVNWAVVRDAKQRLRATKGAG